MVEPNWDYFVNEPLESGTIRFETKTERALYARVIAGEANWMEQQSIDRLNSWRLCKHQGSNQKLMTLLTTQQENGNTINCWR